MRIWQETVFTDILIGEVHSATHDRNSTLLNPRWSAVSDIRKMTTRGTPRPGYHSDNTKNIFHSFLHTLCCMCLPITFYDPLRGSKLEMMMGR